MNDLDYAGDISPNEAWDMLKFKITVVCWTVEV